MRRRFMYNLVRITAIVLLFVVALNAIAAGYSFITDPSGKGLGITTSYLRPTAPFADYFIPGIILFTFLGVLSIIVAVSILIKTNFYPLLLIIQGGIVIGWIAVQLTMVITFHPLHLIIASIGFVLLLIGLFLKKQYLNEKVKNVTAASF